MIPERRFFWWIEERHEIFKKKEQGLPRPWTTDTILDTYRFTNPFRENDKTTVWFRENMRKPLHNREEVFMATIIFRWFNLIQTGETLLKHNLHIDWDPELAREEIKKQDKYVTGGYIIKTPDGMDKVDGVIWCIEKVWKKLDRTMVELLHETNTLKRAHLLLQQFPYLGHFMAYEVVCDLRYTFYLDKSFDIVHWANAGPGAMRGLNRIHARDLNYKSKKHDWNAEMKALYKLRYDYLPYEIAHKMEMREIEHSLCEFDKYERVRNGEGKPRGLYR